MMVIQHFQTRDPSLDFLRGVGLLLVMLAHVSPPAWLFQLRNFDVPLLIAVSATTYAMLYQGHVPKPWPFIKKRVLRLIVPAWVFFSLFFFSAWMATFAMGKAFPFSAGDIAGTYSFYSGIGFVWILRIFLLIALLTPWMLALKQKIPDKRRYFVLLAAVYAVYELGYALLLPIIPPEMKKPLDTLFFAAIPYALLYGYGLRLNELGTNTLYGVTLLALMVFSGMAGFYFLETGAFYPTQYFKYPPRLYYLAYGFFMLNLLFALSRKLHYTGRISAFMAWLSAHSLWIYLWHIFAFYLCSRVFSFADRDFLPAMGRFASIMLFAGSVTFMQVRIVHWLIPKLNQRQRRWLEIIFL